MLDVPFRSAKQLAALVRSKKIGCLELLDLYLERMRRLNPRINAIVATDVEGARRRARAADRALARRQVWGPLHGVPMTLKDCHSTAGMRTTSGYPPLAEYVPTEDGAVAARLKAAGARVLGDGEPKIGAHGKPVLFLHPKDFNGTLVELEQA